MFNGKNQGQWGVTWNIRWPSHHHVHAHWTRWKHLNFHDSWEKQGHWKFHPTFAQWFMDSILLDLLFQLGTWINFQSIIVVPPCYAYPKISTLWIKVKTPMIQSIPCGYCVFCCRSMDGGASTSATFNARHTNINWILPWGIAMLVLFGNKRVLRLVDWLVNVETHNNSYKTLHAHGYNEKTLVNKKTRLWNTLWKWALKSPHWSFPWNRWFKQNWPCVNDMKQTTSKYDIQGPTSFHQVCLLHMWTGIAWKLMQTSSCYSSYMY